MAVSYKKLWKLLIDKDMKKKDLQVAADISSGAISKLGRNENVTTTVLMNGIPMIKLYYNFTLNLI